MNESSLVVSRAFDQQPNESAKAFAAFNAYLQLGAQRSTAAVAKELQKSEQLIRRWCTRHRWVERCEAYDRHLVAKQHEAQELALRDGAVDWAKRKLEQRDEEWKTRTELLELARETIRRWKADPDRCGTLEGIARLLELSSKLGRISAEMDAEKNDEPVKVVRTISVEFRTAIEKIYGKPVPPEFVDVETVKKEAA
jgi:hypothetical protein